MASAIEDIGNYETRDAKSARLSISKGVIHAPPWHDPSAALERLPRHPYSDYQFRLALPLGLGVEAQGNCAHSHSLNIHRHCLTRQTPPERDLVWK